MEMYIFSISHFQIKSQTTQTTSTTWRNWQRMWRRARRTKTCPPCSTTPSAPPSRARTTHFSTRGFTSSARKSGKAALSMWKRREFRIGGENSSLSCSVRSWRIKKDFFGHSQDLKEHLTNIFFSPLQCNEKCQSSNTHFVEIKPFIYDGALFFKWGQQKLRSCTFTTPCGAKSSLIIFLQGLVTFFQPHFLIALLRWPSWNLEHL